MKVKIGKPRRKTTFFQLYFNAPLNAAAGNTALYQVQQVVSQGKRGQKLQAVKVKSAVLGASGESVMLTLGSYRTNQPLQLKATGLTGENGASVAAFETRL